MGRKKLKIRDPLMPVYIADWMSSRTIATMNAEQERGFMRLLMHAWLSGDCSLHDDDSELAALSLMGKKWLGPEGRKVRECFTKKRIGKETKLVNKKLYLLWKERRKHAEKSREGGLKSGVARRSGTNQTRTKLEPNGQPKSNLTSTSSFASTSTTKSIIDAALARVRRETLAETGPLLEWINEAVASGAIDGSKFTRDRVAALAVRCRERGRNGGCALFTTLMRQGKYEHANDDDFSSAVAEIEAHERKPQTSPDQETGSLVKALAENLALKSEGKR